MFRKCCTQNRNLIFVFHHFAVAHFPGTAHFWMIDVPISALRKKKKIVIMIMKIINYD